MDFATTSTTILIGDSTDPQFGTVRRWLSGRSSVKTTRTGAEAIRYFAGSSPCLIVVVHTVPGQYNADDKAELQAAFSEAPVVHLLGTWCEGPLRGDRLDRSTTVVPWHRWRSRLESAFVSSGVSDHQADSGRLGSAPVADARRSWSANGVGAIGLNVGVISGEAETSNVFVELIESLRFQACVVSAQQVAGLRKTDVVLWDDGRGPRSGQVGLRSAVELVAPIPVIAVMSFARSSDIEIARQSGAVDVLCKPFLAEDLSSALCRYGFPESSLGAIAGVPAA